GRSVSANGRTTTIRPDEFLTLERSGRVRGAGELFGSVCDRRRGDGVLASTYRDVQGVVGLEEELLVIASRGGVRGDAAGDVNVDRLLGARAERTRRGQTDAVGGAERGRELGLGHEHQELVAAEARDDVRDAHLFADDLRKLDEITVSLLVSESVVH